MSEVVKLESLNTQFGDIRYTYINNDVWMMGKDVALLLNYSDTKQAIKLHVSEENKLGSRFYAPGQTREAIFINEAGFYQLAMKSKKPDAVQLQNWVCNEVLPSLRANGHYDMNGQSNVYFDGIGEVLANNAINGTERTVLNNRVEIYADMAGVTIPIAWNRFEKCYDNAFMTKLSSSKSWYEKKHNMKKNSLTTPKYLELTDKIGDGIAVINQMIDNKYMITQMVSNPINQYQANSYQNRILVENAKNAYIQFFYYNLNAFLNSMNMRMQDAMMKGNIPCVSFADIPKEYRDLVDIKAFPFTINYEKANIYVMNAANAIFNY